MKDLKTLHGVHKDQIQEGKRKLSQWCVCGTHWGSSLTGKERGDECLKCCTKRMCTYPTMQEEIFFWRKKQSLHFGG